jgi:hypothetical protein
MSKKRQAERMSQETLLHTGYLLQTKAFDLEPNGHIPYAHAALCCFQKITSHNDQENVNSTLIQIQARIKICELLLKYSNDLEEVSQVLETALKDTRRGFVKERLLLSILQYQYMARKGQSGKQVIKSAFNEAFELQISIPFYRLCFIRCFDFKNNDDWNQVLNQCISYAKSNGHVTMAEFAVLIRAQLSLTFDLESQIDLIDFQNELFMQYGLLYKIVSLYTFINFTDEGNE